MDQWTMKRPEDYTGPMQWGLPIGYIDVTTSGDIERKGVPGPDHPYYKTRARVREALAKFVDLDEQHADLYADIIMSAL